MTWIGWVAIILGAIILTAIWAAKSFADFGVDMIIRILTKGPEDEK